MSEEDLESELLAARRAKLERLRADGVEPFPHQFPGVEPIADVLARHEELAAGEETEMSASRRGPDRRAPGLWARGVP